MHSEPPGEYGVYTFSGTNVVHHEPASPRRRRWLRRVLAALVALTLVVVLGGWALVHHLEGNIHTVALTGESPSISAADGKPLNVLVLGSDSRASAADCKIGGDCPKTTATGSSSGADATNGNADVEMLVHLSADRKHADIVSIPRDTVVDLPECRTASGADVPSHRDRINSSMQQGPDCTVRAVEKLTGLMISHVAVIDFQGVITMTNALGGVPVCVDNNVYDPYSHLKLTKGTHTVQGMSALQFVRTRHGFGDGGDVGRTGAQHLFLGAMIRSLRSASTLANPIKLYDVADAATKALTVDAGLAGAKNLAALYEQLDKVPTNAITFITMPNQPDPLNSAALVPAPAATALFQRLAHDAHPAPSKPAAASPGASSASSPSSSVDPSPAGDDPSTQHAATQTQCAHVSTADTVTVNGTVMTPIQAFTAAASVPLSAP